MTTTWTTYQGIEVVESDSTVKYRHPRLSSDDPRLAPLEGATLLALVDGVFLVVCDVEYCNFNGITGNEPYTKPEGEQKSIVDQASSLFSHINGKHRSESRVERRATPVIERPLTSSRYTEDQIKAAIKVWLKWKTTRQRGWAQSAASELERLGFKPFYSEHWNANQLGSLVRTYIKQKKFKNLKAGPMDADDQKAIAELVRDAAAREGAKGGRVVAANVRITEKPPPHKHTPVDFKKIIAKSEAAKIEQQEEDIVPAGNSPTLSFIGPGGGVPEPTPIKEISVDAHSVRQSLDVPATRVRRGRPPGTKTVEESDYEHVVDLPDGSPMFKYKGELMVGKSVKGVEV